MNNIDIQYQNLLRDILQNGVKKQDRTGTGTLSVFGRQIRHQMSEGFPLLSTKKMFFHGIATELVWFLRGETNIKFLLDNNCHIWDGDCYANYERKITRMMEGGITKGWTISDWDKATLPKDLESSMGVRLLTKDEFIGKIKNDQSFAEEWGELGPIYGKQWRSWGNEEEFHNGSEYVWYGPNDQIKDAIETLKSNPDSRRIMVNAWNVQDLKEMALPPCHYGFQFYTREMNSDERINWYCSSLDRSIYYGHKLTDEQLDEFNVPKRKISLLYNARSQDVPLGTPFNIASYGLLLIIVAMEVNMVPDELIANMGDCHIYLNQINAIKEQLERVPFSLPDLIMSEELQLLMNSNLGFTEKIEKFRPEFFKLEKYKSHPAIKIPLSN